jgi:hypothetical protein
MAGVKNGIHVQEYVYDFDVDGGTKDANIVLSSKAGVANIPIGAIIKSVTAKVVTAISGTSSTVSWGTSSTANGYSGTTIAEATLVDNFVVNGWDLDASLLWDGTNDHPLTPYVSSAATGSFVVLISTADLTAGKIVFGVEYWLPTEL